MSYRIEANAEGATIHCLKCGGTSDKPKDVQLRRCVKCGYHSVFPPGMGGNVEAASGDALLGVGVGVDRGLGLVSSLFGLHRGEAVPPEEE